MKLRAGYSLRREGVARGFGRFLESERVSEPALENHQTGDAASKAKTWIASSHSVRGHVHRGLVSAILPKCAAAMPWSDRFQRSPRGETCANWPILSSCLAL